MKKRSLKTSSYGRFGVLMAGSAVLATSALAAGDSLATLSLAPASATQNQSTSPERSGLVLAEAPAIAPAYTPARAETDVTLDLLDELLADDSREIEVASNDLAPAEATPGTASDVFLSGTIPNFEPAESDTEVMVGVTITGGGPDTEVVASVATRDGDGDNAARAGVHYEAVDFCCITIHGEQVAEIPIPLTGVGAGVHDLDRVFYLDVVDTAADEGTIPDFNLPISIQNSTPAPGVTIHGGQYVEGSGTASAYLALIGETALVPVVENTAPFATVMGPDDTAMGSGVDFHDRAGDQISLIEGGDHFVDVCNDGSPDNFCDGRTDEGFPDIGMFCAEAGDARCAVFQFDFDLVDNDVVDGNKQFEARFEAIENATMLNDSGMIVIIDDDGTVSEQSVTVAGRYVFAFGGGTVAEIYFPELDDGGLISIERLDDMTNLPDGIVAENVWGEYLRITTTPPIEPPEPFTLGIDAGDRNGIDDEDINTAWRVVGGEVVEKLAAGKGDPPDTPMVTMVGTLFSDWYVGFEETTRVEGWELID